MRDECIGIPPRFHCEYCPSKFRRKYHLVRHLSSKHGIPKMFNMTNAVTLTQLPQSFNGPSTPSTVKSETDNENIDTKSNVIQTPMATNADRFSVDALMMKQEVPDLNVPLDFSNTSTFDDELGHKVQQPDYTLQRTFQNLKYLFVNYAMNNVPNYST